MKEQKQKLLRLRDTRGSEGFALRISMPEEYKNKPRSKKKEKTER